MTASTNICLLLVALFGYTLSQYLAPPLSGTSFGTNYQTENSGRQETIDEDGNVQGRYSYVDPNGKTINVRYSAGKEGFKIIGEHAPNPVEFFRSAYRPENLPYRGYRQRYAPNNQDLQGYASQAVYKTQEYQPRYTQALFSPSQEPYPAATAGQVKSMQDFLQNEQLEAEKENQMRKPRAQSHVSVQTPNQEYSYNINNM